jgi:hypothetical protein
MPINSFLYPGAKVTSAYEVANSCRWNVADDPSMLKTSASGNQRTFTVSVWLKRSKISSFMAFYSQVTDDNNYFMMNFQSSDKLDIHDLSSGTEQINFRTTAVFRDISAWYHIVCAVDTTQSTQSDRFKLWVNGTQITAFDNNTYPDQNDDIAINVSGEKTRVGAGYDTANYHFDGYMAEVVSIDGTAYDETNFGEFDEDSPTIWKPKDVSGLTFGNNGFYLDFEDSSNLGNDANGGTDFTETNITSIDQTTDTCTNNFCTLNPLINSGGIYSNGNCQLDGGSDNKFVWGTMGTSMNNSNAGWYYEARISHNNDTSNGYGIRVGCASIDVASENGMGDHGGFTTMSNDGSKMIENVTAQFRLTRGGGNVDVVSSIDSGTVGDILNIAWKNGKTFFGVNGTYIAADGGSDGNPASGTNQSHDIDSSVQGDFWNPILASSGSAPSFVATMEVNFGNPTFSISSGNADANGYGNFEYAPPTGFYAICSKNLAEFG